MKNLHEQIDAFATLMKAKGFDGSFHCGGAHPDTLTESMHKYFHEQELEQQPVSSFYLTTYSHWKDEERPYVRCAFKTNYNAAQGFEIETVNITRANVYGLIKELEICPGSSEAIPTREQANRLVGQNVKRLRI